LALVHSLVATAAAIQTDVFIRARDVALTKGLWFVGGEGNCLMLWALRRKEKKRKNWHDAAQVRPAAAAVQIKSERRWLAPIEHVHLGLLEQQQSRGSPKTSSRILLLFFLLRVCYEKKKKKKECVLICVLYLQRWHAEA